MKNPLSTIKAMFSRLEQRAGHFAGSADPEPALPPISSGLFDGLIAAHVDPERASRHAVALRCIAVQAENLAAVPLNLYRRTSNGGREKASDHPLYTVLHDAPNGALTAYEAREFLTTALLIYGNAYARLERNGRGQVTALYPLDPRAVTVEQIRATGRLRYRVSEARGGNYVLTADEMLHLRYRLDRAGIMGLSPLRLASETMGLALAQTELAQAQAVNSFRPAGFLSFPETLNAEQRNQVSGAFKNQLTGSLRTNSLMVLDGGVKFEAFSIPSKDAEFLESRKLANLDVARIFGVPPTVVGIPDHATYSNVEQESRALVQRCLFPLAKRIEQAMTATLISPASRGELFIEHDLAGLMRGDIKSRYDAYKIGREWGWLSPNEIRGWENLPAVDGGEEYLSPLNMAPLGSRAPEEAGAGQ
ncbi:phage portal protein [Glycocaulis alkaliphilus]|uniref:Phage portal protein n=1 Tax=Glycocaulis alkaliphilus TaxID=1434191 RepID=A0A3T0E716_9PROT|nr:phage portal protein [Glycocaulis alkaliphilus]AZU03064.1 phage portal protein [Glycocaulis alkaliphilus]GGB70712.1 portal protein [Glycocaulis alkaliphilus]